MPTAARLLLAWFAVSAVVSPLIGMLLAGGSKAPAPMVRPAVRQPVRV